MMTPLTKKVASAIAAAAGTKPTIGWRIYVLHAEAALAVLASLNDDEISRAAHAIGATPAKLGGPIGARLYDVDLVAAARSAFAALNGNPA